MSIRIDQPRWLSMPAVVDFGGFQAKTHALQFQGWDLAADERPWEGRCQLMLRHRAWGLRVMTEPTNIEYGRLMQPTYMSLGSEPPTPVFRVQQVGLDNTHVIIHGEVNYNFQEIDARPCFTEATVHKFEDLCYFARKGGPEIISTPEKIAKLMEQIHALNEPELQKIQERNRTRARQGQALEGRLIQHAQILSFA